MNRSKNLRLWLVLAMALLLAAGLGWMRFSTPPAPPGNLAGASLGGPFTLTNQDGQTVRDTDFAGRWRLIYFGYGFCPDVCPTDLALVGRGLQEFEAQEAGRAANVAPIFITIDPERDTPAVARQAKPATAQMASTTARRWRRALCGSTSKPSILLPPGSKNPRSAILL